MIFGSIIHETLENLFISKEKSQSSELTYKEFVTLEQAQKIFEEKSKQFLTERVKKDAKSRGIYFLENLYKNFYYFKSGIIAIEKNIKDIKLRDIVNTQLDLPEIIDMKLNGKIDRIEMNDDIIRLIDYKTGSVENAKKKLNGSSEGNP